jgi:hypothetical protein
MPDGSRDAYIPVAEDVMKRCREYSRAKRAFEAGTINGDKLGEAARSWARDTSALLQLLDGTDVTAAVRKALRPLCGLLDYLAAGQVPEPFTDCRKGRRGKNTEGPSKRDDIGIAVEYVRQAKAGLLGKAAKQDRVATVAEAFGLGVRQMETLLKDHKPTNCPTDRLPERMREAGARYKFNLGQHSPGETRRYIPSPSPSSVRRHIRRR